MVLVLHIVAAPGVCGGRPTLKYTRIEAAGTLGRLGAAESVGEIVAGCQGQGSGEAVLEAARPAAEQFARHLPALEPAA